MPKRRPTAAKTKRANAGSLALAADCSLPQAAALRAKLARLLTRASTVTLDAGAVTRIDTASLQLLTAFVRDRRNRGRAVVWRNLPPAFHEAAGLLGLSTVLGSTST